MRLWRFDGEVEEERKRKEAKKRKRTQECPWLRDRLSLWLFPSNTGLFCSAGAKQAVLLTPVENTDN